MGCEKAWSGLLDFSQIHKVLYPTLSGVLGAQSVLFAKCTAELVKSTGACVHVCAASLAFDSASGTAARVCVAYLLASMRCIFYYVFFCC